MKRLLLGFLIAFTTLWADVVFAQSDISISAPYYFGFEESENAELGKWVLNPGANAGACGERWVVGTSVKNGGRRSLYISDNILDEARFGARPDVQFVYRDFTMPAGTYEFSFDYSCLGAPGSYLAAGISYKNAFGPNDIVARNGNALLTRTETSCLKANNLNGATGWKNAAFTFNVKENVEYRVFFVWCNANRDTTLAVPLGACVDNIQISTTNCAKPFNLQAKSTNDTVFVSWSGTSEQYIFERRKRGTDRWYYTTVGLEKSLIIEGLSEGVYDFRVRGICNDVDTSAYAYLNQCLVYYPDQHCVDYLHLNRSNIHGSLGTFKNPDQLTDTILDLGPDNMLSRQTVNTEPDMFDKRTGYRLRTIADGDLGSIRLGNWNVGAQAESLSFEFDVDDDKQSLLLMKYAVVLEDPDHPLADQPRFKLEILDEWGDLISPTCGAADFISGDDATQGWHMTGDVRWKDWTTIGLNLYDMGLNGQTVTVRLTTFDCSWSGHYGYAYFSLDCASAKIYGISCGNDSVLTVEAPSGFDYAWYNKYDSLVSTSAQLSVEPSDTTTYRCRLSYKEEKSCFFDLYSSSKPRYPVSDFTYEWIPSDCENKVRFKSTCHIMEKFDDYVNHRYDEPCDEIQWDFGIGLYSPDLNPVVAFPKEGGKYPVTLLASISEGRCVADTTIIVDIPAIGDTLFTKDTTICQGGWILWGDQYSDKSYYAAEEGTYTASWKSVAGCDSTWVLNLTTRPVSTEYAGDTTVCAEIPLTVDGQTYRLRESGKFYRFYTNQYGCDSTVWMNVTMMDSILPVFEVKDMTSLNTGEIKLSGTGYDWYTVNGEKNGQLSGLNGGVFAFEFFNDFGCSVLDTVILNFACLKVHEVARDFACLDDDVLNITFVKDSGVLTAYSLSFSDEALSKGWKNVEKASLDYVTDGTEFILPIDISSVTTAGIYDAVLVLHDVLCEDVVINLQLQINLSKDIIFQRWGDVLSIKKQDLNGGYSFIGFQWLKNGEKIEGANKSYYYAEEGLDPNAEYQIELLMEDSTVLTTCGFAVEVYTKDIEVRPTQAHRGQNIEVRMPSMGSMKCYTPTGLLVDTRTLEAGHNYWETPSHSGIYMLGIETEDGIKTFVISVTE